MSFFAEGPFRAAALGLRPLQLAYRATAARCVDGGRPLFTREVRLYPLGIPFSKFQPLPLVYLQAREPIC